MSTQTSQLQPRPPAFAGTALPVTPMAALSVWQVVVGFTLLAACLRIAGIGAEALWKNELFSVYWIRQSAFSLATTGMFSETNPPLYFLLLKLWTGLFGSDVVTVRALSAVASTLCVPLGFAVGRALGGRAVGLMAAGLLAVSPVQLYFAHEARFYAFLPLFTLTAMLGLIWFLDASQARRAQGGRSRASAGLALYVASALCLLYGHATAVFLIAALSIAVLLHLIDTRAERRQVGRFLAATSLIGVLALPVVAAIIHLSRSPNIEWMPAFGIDTVLVALHFLLVGPLLRFDIPLAWRAVLFTVECAAALGSLAGIGMLARHAMRARAAGQARLAVTLVAVFPLLFVAMICGVSLLRPILIPRITIWLYVPFAIAAGLALTVTLRPRLHAATAILLAACVIFGQLDTILLPSLHKPDMPGYVRDFQPQAHPDITVFVGPHTGPLGVRYYAGDAVPNLRIWWPDAARPVTTADVLERDTSGAAVVDTAGLRAALQAGLHGQLLLDNDDLPLLAPLRAAVPALDAAARHDYASLVVLAW